MTDDPLFIVVYRELGCDVLPSHASHIPIDSLVDYIVNQLKAPTNQDLVIGYEEGAAGLHAELIEALLRARGYTIQHATTKIGYITEPTGDPDSKR
jgi:hypothetical protein